MIAQPCAHPECDKPMTRPGNVACLPHWKQLPRSLRVKINRHLRGCGDGTSNLSNLGVQLAKADRIWREVS